MADTNQKLNISSLLDRLTDLLDEYLVKKVPNLPESWKNFIAKILPWLTLISLIISIPLILAFFGISLVVLPISFLGGLGSGINALIAWVVLVISCALDLFALPGLFKYKKQGWTYLYWGILLNGVYNLFTLNLGSLIIGTGISLYILFQIRTYYK
jgi:hypothetical protein